MATNTGSIYNYTRVGGRWGTTDEVEDLRLDRMTESLEIIDYEHHEIHAGSSYTAWVADTAMADSDTLIVAFKTPAGTKRAHILVGVSILVAGELTIWEGPTWTQGSGAAIEILNRHRGSTNTSVLLEDRQQATFTASDELIANVTGLNTGAATAVEHVHYFGTKPTPNTGGRGIDEHILKSDSTYAIVFTAVGNSNAGQIVLNWYEHTDKH